MKHTKEPWVIEDGSIMGTWENGTRLQVANISPVRWSPSARGNKNNARLAAETPHNGPRIVDCVNAMRHVTIPDGQEPEGAVREVIEAGWALIKRGSGHYPKERARLWAALARFKVDDTEEGA